MGFFVFLHSATSYLGFLWTLFWVGGILFGAGDIARFPTMYRKCIYLPMMVLTGLSAVFGIIVTLFGPWLMWVFPWVGFAGIAVHNILGAKSRRALYAMQTGTALKFAAIQLLVLIIVLILMIWKPF
ncbi:hypothetical protein [Ketogulonicigenium vulgare]|uniref:Protoporphyrinogen IX oxidase n=1 Tax=Ketogulonicigenium vulgare (strain WSH-001) TaxID=759362 RepID=F9Y3P2_KETVW|nr:hypothetical protein [Ketogulonicigenium vulgare]ADO42204.1 hypothetical protein EIO_1057 [Ketogulonicigenium vulgare Y25]AEM40406.1 hypothetical protein KVU_0568 [Ketogulonicigenium vulgare WSH-001]ALJ80595.1 hypothetical protein KVH_05030 [Ketogulonicigenium vulgare]ANW33413.1 hypothetical protein KvSKV_05000 [Ketogulonicigenium vulgare]AOZ54121.1 hypothetical protein KVC_1104 [Ketogulonicigenium vulgare]